jgi:hypothetical protein
MTDLSRRRMLGVAASVIATATGSVDLVHSATAAEAGDLDLFVKVSAALTGIAEKKLAPTDYDPTKIKLVYFNQAKSDPGFDALMRIVRANSSNPAAAADKIMNNTDVRIKYLGRSIIMAWYLGAWYPPDLLQQTPPSPVRPAKIISRDAYTEAWACRVAQAHPMGYSESQFGYWSNVPMSLDEIIKG